MPYSLFWKNNKWQIKNKKTGKIVGKSDTKEKAKASIRQGWQENIELDRNIKKL